MASVADFRCLSVRRGEDGRIARVRHVLPRHKAANWVGPGRGRSPSDSRRFWARGSTLAGPPRQSILACGTRGCAHEPRKASLMGKKIGAEPLGGGVALLRDRLLGWCVRRLVS